VAFRRGSGSLTSPSPLPGTQAGRGRGGGDLVTIVVVAWNNWPELELTIRSALHQSYEPLEVIVIDNSSTDQTPAEVERIFGDRIRYVRQANVGDAGAYNRGVREARGEFIQFLDGDDVLTPYKIEKQMAVVREHPDTDIVYGDVRLFKAKPGVELIKDTDMDSEDDLLQAFLESKADYFGNTLAMLIRRSLFDRIGDWDETVWVTDADLWLRALASGARFRHSRGLMGFVSVGPGKMSSNAAKMLAGQERLWTKALGYLHQEPHRSMVRSNLAQVQYLRAVQRWDLSPGQAIAKLRESRAVNRDAVPMMAYAAALAGALIPGGRYLANSPAVRPLRRLIARVVGYRRY
jgi:hypothetical protein